MRLCLTQGGLVRNLTAAEIVGVSACRGALNIATPVQHRPMAWGAAAQYDETMKALRILADEHGFDMSPRRITLSTVGLLPALERLAREPVMPNLAISLHAPTDLQRGELVPINRKYGVSDIIEACKRFPLKKRSRITFEYVLAGVNDRRRTRAGSRSSSPASRRSEPDPAERRARHPVRSPSTGDRSLRRDRSEHGVACRTQEPRRVFRAACGNDCRGSEKSAAQQLAS